ncbi:MAG: von Willebrand factor type A domain-containing protein [Saprospiraceae bacterium]
MKLNCYMALFLGVLLSQPLFSQTILTGKVTDSKESLIGATIKVLQNGNFIRGTVTDFNGEFRIQLDTGIYRVECNYTGCAPFSVEGVKVEWNKLNTLNITLSNAGVLDEVTVSGKKPLIKQHQAACVQVLSAGQIQNLPAQNVNTIKDDSRKFKKNAAPRTSTRSESDAYKMQVYPAMVHYEEKPKEVYGYNSIGKPIRDTLDEYSGEQYNRILENPFQDAKTNGISTFSIDVDAASYSNIRRFLNSNQLPPRDAVRIEEMINYFDYQYEAPRSGRHPFEVNTEIAPCPWNPKNRLMTIGIQGEKIDLGQLPASNLVFLIDVSGSMSSENKLPLVKQSLSMLTDQLRPNDRVAIVVYAGAAGLVLESTSGADKPKIKAALEALGAGGSTAGGAGIKLAYETARKNLIANGNNRVILCSDGDFNVGQSSEAELVKLIENERKSGVYLTILGYGMGNYQDGKMQSLADKGNGNHAYIDQLSEAKKVLMQEFGGILFAIAKDVKLQLHFNPRQVAGYRLIGYENRMLATEDFNNDAKDAGELGAGHRVTAIYEIVPAGQSLPTLTKADSALVVVTEPDTSVTVGTDDLMVLQLRYKKPKGEQPSQLMEYRLNAAALDRKTESENFMLASAIAEFGMLLRDSKHKGSATYERAISRARKAAKNDPSGYRTELVQLMEKAQAIAVPLEAAKK